MWCFTKISNSTKRLQRLLLLYPFILILIMLMTLPYVRRNHFMDISKLKWDHHIGSLISEPVVFPLQPCWPHVNSTGNGITTDCFYECLDRNTRVAENDKSWSPFVSEDALNVSKLNEIPITLPYLPTSRNPCFMLETTNATTLRCLPYFFLAGFPKTGTTDLYQRLRLHRYIQSPVKKEPHWWSNARRKPFSYYLSQFPPNQDFQNISRLKTATTLFGDFSTREFLDENVTTNVHWDPETNSTLAILKRILPCARLLVMLRDPVDRLYSDYLYFSGRQLTSPRDKKIKHITPADFHDKCLRGIQWWKACLHSYRGNIRYCLHSAPNITGHPPLSTSHSRCWNQPDYTCKAFKNGMYYYYIKEWLQIFPKSQFMFVRLEEYSRDKIRAINKVLRFLGTRQLNGDEMQKVRQMYKQVPGGALLRTRYPPMYNETRRMLQEFYRESNVQLAKLLGDDNYIW